MRYKCVESFNIPRVDGDWNHTDGEIRIEKDSVWCLEERETPRIADAGGISLINEEGGWLEIYPEDLKQFFEALEETK